MFDSEHGQSAVSSKQTHFETRDQDNSLHNFVDSLVRDQSSLAIRESSKTLTERAAGFATSKSANCKSVQKISNFISICKESLFSTRTNPNKYEINISKIMSGALMLWSLAHIIRYAMLSAKSVTIKEASPPSPFFRNSNAFIRDFYDGNIDEPELLINRAAFTIVMLYSPWDSRSKEFRRSFIEIAASFQNLTSVKFVAANCNYHRGKCRKMYKLLSFPVIFAHTPYGQPIVFNQVLSSDRLFRWILHLLAPLNMLHSVDDFQRLTYQSDFVVVGHFALGYPNFPLPRSYNIFLNSAYKAVDQRSSLAFGVVLNANLASELEIPFPNVLHFYTFYDDENPPKSIATFTIDDKRTKSQDVIHWVNECMMKYTSRSVHELELEDLETPGKLETLSRKINSANATLVLFTNILGLREQSNSLIALKNFAKMFNYCPTREELSPPNKFQANTLNAYFADLKTLCQMKTEQFTFCCEQMVSEPCGHGIEQGDKKRGEQFNTSSAECLPEVCATYSHDKSSFKRKCDELRRWKSRKRNSTSSFPLKINWRLRMECKLRRLIRREHREIFREFSNNNKNLNEAADLEEMPADLNWLIGAGCRFNQTIGFLTIDKHHGRHFMRKWGLDEARIGNDSAAIVSRTEERIFWMEQQQQITMKSLAYFVSNFTNGTLKWIPENEQIEEDDGVEEEIWHGYPVSRLEKLNWDKFHEEILKNDQRKHDAVIFFSGGDWHGPSRSVLHYLHQTRHYFQEFNEYIRFYILDTSKNSLPWEYSFERLPVMLFFPAKRLRESHLFPMEMAFTLPNLVGFILPRCQDQLRWRLAFAFCKADCLTKNLSKIGLVLQKIRNEIRSLRKVIAHWRIRKTITPLGLQNFKIQLRRRQLQKAVLVKMLNLVHSLREGTIDTAEQQRRRAAKEAELLTYFLANRFGLEYKFF